MHKANIAALPSRIHSKSVWLVSQENAHSFARVLVMLGQLQTNAGVQVSGESMLTPHTNMYGHPLDGHPGDAVLTGVFKIGRVMSLLFRLSFKNN